MIPTPSPAAERAGTGTAHWATVACNPIRQYSVVQHTQGQGARNANDAHPLGPAQCLLASPRMSTLNSTSPHRHIANCSGKDVDANTLRECVATAGGSIGPHTELGDLQVLHGDSLDDVNVADAAAAAAPDSKHVLYASLTDLNDSGGFPDLLLSVLQPSLGTQGPNQQLYQRLHQQHQGRPPAQPSRRPPPPPPQLLLIWAPVHSSASGQHPHLVSDEDGLVVQQLGEQEWRACKGRLEARGAVLGLAALRPLVGLHYSGAVYCAASVAALRGELARLGAALRRGGPAAAAGGGATQAKQVRKLLCRRAEQCGLGSRRLHLRYSCGFVRCLGAHGRRLDVGGTASCVEAL